MLPNKENQIEICYVHARRGCTAFAVDSHSRVPCNRAWKFSISVDLDSQAHLFVFIVLNRVKPMEGDPSPVRGEGDPEMGERADRNKL